MDTDDQSAMIPPRYQRLSDELAEAIHGGRLPVGSRLPSLRQMALQRRLSLNTVIAAYRQLEDAGLVIPRPKAGFEVAPRLSVPERSLRDTPSAPTAPLQQALMARVLEAQRRPGVIDLAFAGPRGRQFYPGAQLARHTAQVLRHGQQTVETYARPNGSPRLLAQIVRRGPRMGLHTHSDRLLLTHGAMEALQLALRAVTRSGDAVGIEAPSYFNLYPLLATLGLQAIELPTHPQQGLDVDALEALLEHTALAALVVMPTVHNPLGCTMPTSAKQRLAELVNARQLPLIEDAVYAELQFCEPPAPLLKAFDRDGWVMVVGGFSKTLAPDYRIGWLEGGRFAERIALLKFQSTGGEPQLLGDAVAAYLEAGSYEHHLHRMRRLYREQVGRLRQLVAEHFPAGTRATEPQGGFLLWLELPGVDTRELFERALQEDIVLGSGIDGGQPAAVGLAWCTAIAERRQRPPACRQRVTALAQRIARFQQCCQIGGQRLRTCVRCGQQHRRHARMRAQRQHPATERGDRAGFGQRAQSLQQFSRCRHRSGRRWIEEAQVAAAPGRQFQCQPGQFHLVDLGAPLRFQPLRLRP